MIHVLDSVCRVCVLAPIASTLSYGVPQSLLIKRGDLVRVPLAHHSVWALVLEVGPRQEADPPTLKMIIERLDETAISEASLRFWLWAKDWTMSLPGVFISGCLRALKAPHPRQKRGYVRATLTETPLSPARQRVWDACDMALSAQELAQLAGVSTGVITAMAAKGLLCELALTSVATMRQPDPDFRAYGLNDSQKSAHQLISQQIAKGGFSPILIDGVTGSGKTEVYLECVADQLRASSDAQILILLPEIALTSQLMARFAQRFGCEPVVWHSGLTPSSRRRIFEDVAAQRTRLVVGARSALFLPFTKLDLIIVDEEHDASFKQEEGVRYQARDLAVRRAQMEACPIILASATPSLESLVHAQAGRYFWVRMDARYGDAVMPDIALIDMKTRALCQRILAIG